MARGGSYAAVMLIEDCRWRLPPRDDRKSDICGQLTLFDRLAAEIPSLRSVSDHWLVLAFSRDCARELPLPIHPIVCFEVGRFTLTQSSRPTLTQRCSRKWMSGHAAYALVLSEDRGQFATLMLYPSGEHLLPSQGEAPLPLDCYLSWMSPLFVTWFCLPRLK